MSVVPNVVSKKRKKSESKPQSQLNKCLNEKRRREQENIYIEELAELISASTSDMSSLSVKPDKCAILQETVNQIHRIKQQESGQSDELQQSEVSSSKPTILAGDVLGPLLLEALDGFLFVVNTDGKIEFVSENIASFLKYSEDDLVEKSIYNIIHAGDHARFSSSLLPMSIGNGFGWSSEPNCGSTKNRCFNCRFLIKPPDNQEETMEEKQTRVSQYENMQISAVLQPFPGEKTENSETNNEVQNRLVCVARRIPPNEKNSTSVGVEQFTTRLDISGKILAIDTSGVSSPYKQYLDKDLVGRLIHDFCHSSDSQKLSQHLKDTLQAGSNTSGVYRLRVAQDKYVHVHTKSKRFSYNHVSNEQEFIMATHSIIKESDGLLSLESSTAGNRQNSSVTTVSASTTSASGAVSLGSSSMNGGITTASVSPLTGSNSYTFPALSPNGNEFALNDLMTMFPTPSWELDSGASRDSEGLASNLPPTSMGGCGYMTNASPQHTPATNCTSGNSRGPLQGPQQQQPSSSAFSPELMASGKGSPRTQSPATAGRVTPFTNAFSFSPVQTQPSSGKASPSSASSVGKKGEDVAALAELSGLSPATSVSGLIPDARTTQKLRNLLTQGLEDVDSSPSKSSSSEGNTTPNSVISDCDASAITRINQSNPADGMNTSSSGNENVILRELLNQDDDELSDIGKSMQRLNENKSTVSLSSPDLCNNEGNLDSQKKIATSNNMLRKLLNSDEEGDRSYRKPQDLIQQLLKAKSPDKSDSVSGPGDTDSSQTHRTSEVLLKQLALDSGRSSSPCLTDVSLTKRKSPEERASSDSAPKRPTMMVPPHAHLAGQNPMLASMLAQTPRTPPSVPTSIANSIISQLPQERLPKNLEQKLVHTPFTGNNSASTTTPPTQTQTTSRLTVTSLQQEVVNADSRGHITLAQHHSINSIPSSSGISMNFSQSHPPQGFLSKILTSTEGSQLSQSFATPVSTSSSSSAAHPVIVPQQQQHQSTSRSNTTYGQFSRASQQSQSVPPNITAASFGLRDMLGEATRLESTSSGILANQSSDPLLSEILDQVWSMQQEMNLEASSTDDTSLLKILDEVLDPPAPAPSPHPAVTTVQDINEKMAISAIQRQLMSFEGPRTSASPPHPGAVPICNLTSGQTSGIPNAVSQLSPNSLASFSSSHYSSSPQPPSYNSSVVVGQRPRLPTVVPSGSIMPNNQAVIGMPGIQRVSVPHYGSNSISPHVINLLKLKKTFIDNRRQKYLQQHHKRLLAQQQQQHLTMQTQQPVGDSLASSGSSTFPENMTDFDNTVAPNVTLQRSTSMPEQQLSPRYNTSMMNQLPSPVGQPPPNSSQLSPGQRVNQQSPYSPLSQQSFSSPNPPTTNYQQSQQHRLSPHSIPSYPQGGPSHSTSPVPSGVTGGSRSPHLQLSPQQGSVPPQWNQRPPQSPIQNNLQQQNPMLNAQLSQSAYNGQPRFPAQQRPIQMRSMPSPGSLQPSRNSPFPGQPDGAFSPLSPVAVYQGQPPPTQQQTQQQQQQQQRLQRAISVPGRVNSPRTPQGGYVGGEPLLSPQPQPSPSYSQSLPGTPATNFPSGSGLQSGNPAPNYSLAQDNTHFPFDQQSLQAFTSSAGDRVRAGSGNAVCSTSEYVRQELRAVVGARTQQQQQQQHHAGQLLFIKESGLGTSRNLFTLQQQHPQSLHQLRLRTTTPPTGPPSSQSLSRTDLEALGLSLEIGPSDVSPASPAIFSQSLLSIAGSQEAPPGSHGCITSPRMEDAKPSDQKKSLLQQLLSEPT